ncbi:MAG: XTP/dITP diphosphatase [Ruminococcaceae bacterium]|nr:XTP/dITP diphosphatase [Oscillospiraceae bacterium]
MKTIVIATNNKNKLAEFKRIFSCEQGSGYRILSLADVGFCEEIEENADTFQGNALLKARAVSKFTGLCAVADDSGLQVDYLNGAPGVYSARYAGEGASSSQLIAKLLSEMKCAAEDERTARFVSVMCAYFPNGQTVFAEGICEGSILYAPAGENGFGYDPVFYYQPMNKTFAEMDSVEKNSISHRALATADLLDKLKNIDKVAFDDSNA